MNRLSTPLALIPAGVASVLLFIVPVPASAILGLGELVYDPTNFARAGEELDQDIKIVQQALLTYDLLKSELRMIQARPWQTVATRVGQIAMEDLGPEASSIAKALITAANGIGDPRAAWNGAMVTMPTLDSESFAGTNTPSHAAAVQMTDAFATDSLRTIGAWRQNQTLLANAVALLQSKQESTAEADNTPVAQANITNGALVQILKMQQTNAALQTVLAEQATAANAWQRNNAAEALSIQLKAMESRSTEPTDYGSTSGTLNDYLIK